MVQERKCPECGHKEIKKGWKNRALNENYVSCGKCRAIYLPLGSPDLYVVDDD